MAWRKSTTKKVWHTLLEWEQTGFYGGVVFQHPRLSHLRLIIKIGGLDSWEVRDDPNYPESARLKDDKFVFDRTNSLRFSSMPSAAWTGAQLVGKARTPLDIMRVYLGPCSPESTG